MAGSVAAAAADDPPVRPVAVGSGRAVLQLQAPVAAPAPMNDPVQEITHRPGASKMGEWLCPGCGKPDFRLEKKPVGGKHLFTVRCANCRREAGMAFPC